MKKTLADLLGPRGYSDDSLKEGMQMLQAEKTPDSNKERVFTVSIVLAPFEVEILDNKVVIEKRVLARNRREALEKCEFTVKD